jgi:GntR family transcriptional regulator
MPLDFDPTRPIYLQIIEAVKKRTAQGVYQSGGSLPSVREMAKEMGVNPNTMSRSYMELEREGFITTRRGEGSFITENDERIDSERHKLAQVARDRFIAEMRDLALSHQQIEDLLREIQAEVKQ